MHGPKRTLMIIKGEAVFMNPMKLMRYPLDSAIPMVTTLADAPMIVPFPPKQAPSAKAHQRVFSAPGMTALR